MKSYRTVTYHAGLLFIFLFFLTGTVAERLHPPMDDNLSHEAIVVASCNPREDKNV